MLSKRTNYICFSLLAWCMGLFGLYSGVSIFYKSDAIERGFILVNYSNPLIKFSPSLCFIFMGFAFMLIPVLIKKKFMAIGSDLLAGSKFVKAKGNLTLIILFLPAVLFAVASAYFSHFKIGNYPLFVALIAVGVYYPISSIYGVIKYKNQT